MPAKLNFKLYQGSTFSETLRWETSTKVYKPISAISKSAPCIINSIAHGVPSGWRVRITNVSGMTEINSNDLYHTATVNNASAIELNAINSLGYKDYVSGGVIEYNQPADLTGFTARMQLREKLDSATTIVELTTENGGIVIDNTAKTISLIISAAATALYTFSSAVYSLEMVSSGGQVTPFASGTITLVKEVTR